MLRHLAIRPLLDWRKKHKSLENMSDIFPIRDFALGCQEAYPQYSYNECENVYRKLFGVLGSYEKNRSGVFSLFHKIAHEALRLEGNDVRCKHSEMVRWRETVHSVGQSVFICALLAHEDVQRKSVRTDFALSPYAPSDSPRLRNMLSLGMAENHFHLKGSAPAFLMSWVCLMNHIEKRNGINGFNSSQMKDRFFRAPAKDEGLTLCQSTQIAAYIRLHLNRWLNGDTDTDSMDLNRLFGRLVQVPHAWISDIQRKINVDRKQSGDKKLDYAGNNEDKSKTYWPIAGEHRFLYRMFHAIYSQPNETKDVHIPFMVYLIAYMRLRAELVQSNTVLGFQNFQEYQNRKEIFLDDYPTYKDAYIKMALDSSLRHSFIKSLEARFCPNPKFPLFFKTAKGYLRMSSGKEETLYKLMEKMRDNLPEKRLENVLRDINPYESRDIAKDEKLFFVTFLVKKSDKSFEKGSRKKLGLNSPTNSRHYALQKGEYSKQINNIIRLRHSRDELAKRLYGIDACDDEANARPEVFAYLFRKARHISSGKPYPWHSGEPLPRLGITYHVGEDFFDITGGLRAIEEAIIFLELSHGDRLGHALALGIDPAEYYALKGNRLFMSRQELLDNLTWLSRSLHMYGLFDSALESWMYDKIQEHFLWLYRSTIQFSDKYHTVNKHVCTNAWHLRGVNPKYYRDVDDDDIFARNIKFAELIEPWDLLQDDVSRGIREKDKQARQLMHFYHYSPTIRTMGEEIVELQVPEGYAKNILALQDAMLRDVCRRGIAIETNPSSNYLIGTFRQYHKHPILRFYNRWLNSSRTSPQAFVSINTDDQGVFDTDLENEYALMASALENAVDENGHPVYDTADIFNWLDDIRKMGLEQSFMLTHRNLTEGR